MGGGSREFIARLQGIGTRFDRCGVLHRRRRSEVVNQVGRAGWVRRGVHGRKDVFYDFYGLLDGTSWQVHSDTRGAWRFGGAGVVWDGGIGHGGAGAFDVADVHFDGDGLVADGDCDDVLRGLGWRSAGVWLRKRAVGRSGAVFRRF